MVDRIRVWQVCLLGGGDTLKPVVSKSHHRQV